MLGLSTARREEYRIAVAAGHEALDGRVAGEEIGLGDEDAERWTRRGRGGRGDVSSRPELDEMGGD